MRFSLRLTRSRKDEMRYQFLVVWWKDAGRYPTHGFFPLESEARDAAHDLQDQGYFVRIYDLTVDTNANQS